MQHAVFRAHIKKRLSLIWQSQSRGTYQGSVYIIKSLWQLGVHSNSSSDPLTVSYRGLTIKPKFRIHMWHRPAIPRNPLNSLCLGRWDSANGLLLIRAQLPFPLRNFKTQLSRWGLFDQLGLFCDTHYPARPTKFSKLIEALFTLHFSFGTQ